MNRRQMTRLGLIGGLMIRPGIGVLADEPPPMPDVALPMEPVPESAMQDPPASLREAVAQGRVIANWVSATSNQVRLILRSDTDRPGSVRIDPCTILTDGQAHWLAGGPSRYEGSFGGVYAFDAVDGLVRSSIIPLSPGRETSLLLPVLRLTDPQSGATAAPGKTLKAGSVETWSGDKPLSTLLTGLSILGTSLPVAQGIAWRAVESKSWKDLAHRTVQGRVLNEFEKIAADRFIEKMPQIGSVAPEALRIALLEGLMSVHVRRSAGKEAVTKRLTSLLVDRYLFGLPLGSDPEGEPGENRECPMRLDIAVIEIASLEPLRVILDCSLSSRSEAPGGSIRWARLRMPLGSESSDPVEAVDRFLEELTARFARALVRTEKIGQGSMFTRLRLENHSPWTISAVALRTDRSESVPAVWPIDGLGLAPRGRAVVQVPAERGEPIDLRFAPI